MEMLCARATYSRSPWVSPGIPPDKTNIHAVCAELADHANPNREIFSNRIESKSYRSYRPYMYARTALSNPSSSCWLWHYKIASTNPEESPTYCIDYIYPMSFTRGAEVVRPAYHAACETEYRVKNTIRRSHRIWDILRLFCNEFCKKKKTSYNSWHEHQIRKTHTYPTHAGTSLQVRRSYSRVRACATYDYTLFAPPFKLYGGAHFHVFFSWANSTTCYSSSRAM